MCLLMLVLCAGVASSASVHRSGGGLEHGENCGGVYKINEYQPQLGSLPPGHRRQIRLFDDRSVLENYNDGGEGHYREERQGFDRRRGPDGPAPDIRPIGARPSGPGRPLAEPLATPPRNERRGFGDRSNEITDENIDRIRTTIYSNVPSDRQPLYANSYRHEQNNFNGRRSGIGNERREAAADGTSIGGDRRYPDADVNQSRGDSWRGTSEDNPRREPNTSFGSRGANNGGATNSRSDETGTSGTATRGREEGSTWVWSSSVETTTAAGTTPQDLDNRASFSGDNCPTGQIKVEGKCVETH